MSNITLSVPEEIKHKMEKFPEINWSALIKKFLESKVERLVWKEQMLKGLEIEREFDEQALLIGNKIKEDIWKKLKKKGW